MLEYGIFLLRIISALLSTDFFEGWLAITIVLCVMGLIYNRLMHV